jgi:hypothetical protein
MSFMSTQRCCFIWIAALLFIDFASFAAFTWEKKAPPGPSYRVDLAYDKERSLLIAFGEREDEIWQWNGSQWSVQQPENYPPKLRDSAIAYDERRKSVLFFGGEDDLSHDVTDAFWEWDGANWKELFPAHKPTPRMWAMMKYDEANDNLVLSSGRSWVGGPGYGDTWIWDGTDWTEVFPEHHPQEGLLTAYENHRSKVLLVNVTEIWEWDGLDWNEIIVDNFPRMDYLCLAYDPIHEYTVFLGKHFEQYTWLFDGSTLTRVYPEYDLNGLINYKMYFDEVLGQVIAYGGKDDDHNEGNMYGWDGEDWVPIMAPIRPPDSSGTGLAGGFEDHGVVLFGGDRYHYTDGTWEFQDGAWIQHFPADSPPGRGYPSMTGDYIRNVIVMFGGERDAYWSADTWEYDFTTWIQKHPFSSPGIRVIPGFAFDGGRGVSVMFGGWLGNLNYSDETWIWDGNDWELQHPETSPPRGEGPCMAYDEVRDRVVMYGGVSQDGSGNWEVHYHTWEWDGTNWEERITQTEPGGTFDEFLATDFNMTYHRQRERILMLTTLSSFSRMWEYDGIDWTELPMDYELDAEYSRGLAYSTNDQQIVTFGGDFRSNTWVGYFYNPTSTPIRSPTPTPTPTATVPITATPSPSCSPSQPPTNAPSSTPSPTPEPWAGVRFIMPDNELEAGDMFRLRAECRGNPEYSLADLYVILDVYGNYWFWPGWSQDIEFQTISLNPDRSIIVFILDFKWPSGDFGSADGLMFWGALLDPQNGALIGNYDHVEFGYS